VFYLFAAGHRSVYLLPIYPTVALLAARECAAFLDRRGKAFSDSQTAISRWAAAAVFIATIDSALALAIPITRTAQEDTNDQEAFVEDVVPKIPATATLYATPEFPKTARMVLSYRLKRYIPLRRMTCEGDYYYLMSARPGTSCTPNMTTRLSAPRKREWQLLHVSDASRWSE
jgi:hypothetical protein